MDTRAAIYQALKKEYFPIIAHLSMHDNKGKAISSGTMIWCPKWKLKQRQWVNGIPCCLRTEGGESSNLVCARRYEQGFLPKELQNFEEDTNKACKEKSCKSLLLLFVGFNMQTKFKMWTCLLFWVTQEKRRTQTTIWNLRFLRCFFNQGLNWANVKFIFLKYTLLSLSGSQTDRHG